MRRLIVALGKASTRMVAAAIDRAFVDSDRWLSVRSMKLHGLAFGRRFVDSTGILVTLSLRPWGDYEVRLVPWEGRVPARPEREVREAVVQSGRRGWVKEHEFESSPVLEELCAVCAENKLAHQRRWLEERIRLVLSTIDVIVTFEEGSCAVADIKVRTSSSIGRPPLNPLPDSTELPNVIPVGEPYRSLSEKERTDVLRYIQLGEAKS